jgi:eukaryotic-like serine/threonine-protein kinase
VRPGGGAPSWILQVSDTANFGPLAAFWADDNRVYYSDNRGIHAVSTDGGEPETIVADGGASAPHVLPGSRAMLYHRGPASEIVLYPFDGAEPVVLASGVGARYIEPGFLLFVRDGALMGARLDLGARRLRGEPVPLGEQIATMQSLAQYDVASDGTLVYLPPSATAEMTAMLLRRTRDGQVTPLGDAAQPYSDPRVSPDGRLIALHVAWRENDIWIHDTARGSQTRLTFDPREDETPVWSPDGDWIAFAGFVRDGHERAVFRRRADGSGGEELLWTGAIHAHVTDWSPDGRSLVLEVVHGERASDIMLLTPGDPVARLYLASRFSEAAGRISPDGRWLAYHSDESGEPEVYVLLPAARRAVGRLRGRPRRGTTVVV